MVGQRALLGVALAACALTASLLPASVGDAASAASPATSASVRFDVIDTFERDECPVEVLPEDADRVTCGVLIVPEWRFEGADPERTLRLPVAYIESTSPDATSDPLVFPTRGGPGGGSLSALGYFLEYGDWATEDRDVILLEQRGDALADPTLDCPELDIDNFVVDGSLLAGAAAETREAEQLEACRLRLTEAGIDLAAYTSAESADDLADLRTAFGYDSWNLYGVSYGARLALTTMRDRPEGLRAVILDGVVPPHINRYEQTPAGFTSALDALFASCAADTECREQYPDLEDSLLELLERAAEEPLEVTVKHPVDRTPLALEVSDTDFVAGLFNALYDADLVRVLPYLIDRLAAGDAESATPLAQQNVDFDDYLTEGLGLSIDCAEEAPFNDDERIAEALAADPVLAHYPYSEGFREECAIWQVPALSDVENAPVVSSVPTLLTTGEYDPVTPTAFAEAAAEHLPAHYLYTFPGMGHGVVWANWYDDCAADIAQQFLRDPTTEPDSSCIEEMPATRFVTGEDIHPTSAVYRFGSDVLQDRDPVPIAILGLSLLVFIATLIYGAVYGLVWLGRRRGDAPGGAMLAAVTSSGLNLAYVGGMAIVLMNTDSLILGFGLPSGVWPLLIVPFVALGAGILLTVLMVRAWMQGEGGLFPRVALSVSAFASLGFALWLLARGLLML
jgi:pimeloyl-ACP methyl ester carboxylesterase